MSQLQYLFQVALLISFFLLSASFLSSFAEETSKSNPPPAGDDSDNDNAEHRSAHPVVLPPSDVELLEFPLNLEFLEAEFFLWGALGVGLDMIAPQLAGGGPSPTGVARAALDPFTRDIILQFAFQEVGHIRAIKATVPGFARPQMDLSPGSFAKVMNMAFGRTLIPPFNPYVNSINYLLACYIVPYVGLTGYVGANPLLTSRNAKRLVAGLLGVESGQDAVIRMLLYQRARHIVYPYGISVAEFTSRISMLRNRLGKSGIKDEGIIVPPQFGPEGHSAGNILAGDSYSISYRRSPEEILRIVYGTGDEHNPGGFYPAGANGRIAKSYFNQTQAYHHHG